MKKLLQFLIILFNYNFFGISQSLQTELEFSLGSTQNEVSYSHKVDNNGNIIMLGSFIGTIDFDKGINEYNLTATTVSVYIAKYTSDGTFIWAKQIANANRLGSDFPSYLIQNSLIIDGTNNIYITGNFWGTTDFDPNNGITNLTSSGGTDIFILKLTQNGELIWAQKKGSTGDDSGTSIDLDQNGDLVVIGFFLGMVIFGPNNSIDFVNTASNRNTFIYKLTADGVFIWVKKFSVTSYSIGINVQFDKQNNIIIIGNFIGQVDFDPIISPTAVYNLTSAIRTSYIVKLNNNGLFQWAQKISDVNAFTIDNSNNIYLTGNFSGTVSFLINNVTVSLQAISQHDILFLKLDPNGSPLIAKQFGSNSFDNCATIDLDADGNIYLAGIFNVTGIFDDTVMPPINTLTNNMIIYKLNPIGVKIYEEIITSTKNFVPNCLTILANNKLIVSGYFDGSVNSNINNSIVTQSQAKTSKINMTTIGGNDVFIIKLKPYIATPLPVRLISFTGKPTEKGNLLEWKTSFEQNFSHYEIERSSPPTPGGGISTEKFEKIGRIDGAGNTKENLSYSFLDNQLFGSQSNSNANQASSPIGGGGGYYRLKMIDLDGKSEYSKVISIKNNAETEIKVYPNPAIDFVNIENLYRKSLNIRLLDALGREKQAFPNTSESNIQIDVQSISTGTYYIQINEGAKVNYRKVTLRR